MKILHYIPSIDRTSGGVGAYMQLLTKELGKLIELHVVTHRSDNELPLENCQLHYISANWKPWANTKKEFKVLLHDINPDVFHTNCCWLPLSAMTSMWAKAEGYKVIYTPHGMLEPWIMSRNYWTKKWLAIQLFQRKGVAVADIVHSTADSEKDNLEALGWNRNIHVIPNCVDLDKIPSTIIDSQRENNILFLSRIHVKKGINFLIEAVAQMKHELNGWTITIAGEGDSAYITELKSLATRLGVSDMINFAGGVYGDEKWNLFGKAKLFVLPTHSENFGIVVAEALACGVPVITTKGTPWHELQSDNCGWWTEIGTESTVEALRSFLALKDSERKEMGVNGRALIEQKYSCKVIAKKFVEMYERVKNEE